ncbi:MAG: cation transporter [Planctomycetes bacterium]|nr:cation transporter [Planctomycetota bacterium]
MQTPHTNWPRRARVGVVGLAAILGLGACAQDGPYRAPKPHANAPVVVEPSTPSDTQPTSSTPDPLPPRPVVPPQASGENAKNYLTYIVKVTGMTCPFKCVREVKEQLLAVEGVLDVQIDYDHAKVTVNVRPGTDPETLVAGLKTPYAGRLL